MVATLTVKRLPGRPKAEERAYEPRGAALQLFYRRAPEVLIEGPSGTGKSRACLEKLYLCAQKYPKMRGAIVRKTRESLTQSAMVTFETEVLPYPGAAPFSHESQEYQLPNGSVVVVGGLDKTSRIMSTQYDLIYVQESTELEEGDWEDLTTRLRNGVMPFQQIIACCNPDAPDHWLNQRCLRGQTVRLQSRHEDNPTITPEYLAKLDTLTGYRHQRLRRGLWVAAEGMFFTEWDPEVHVVPAFEIPADWTRFLSVDYGFAEPFCCFDDQTEILTEAGWRLFADLPKSMRVATVNPESKTIEWQQPSGYLARQYHGPMVYSEPRREGVNFAVTPNHRMVVADFRKPDEWRFARADALPVGTGIPKSWGTEVEQCDTDEPFEVPHGQSDRPGFVRRRLPPVSREAFAKFLGLFLAEGSFHKRSIRVSQKNRVEAVREAFAALGWPWKEYADRSGVISFTIFSADLCELLSSVGGTAHSRDKRAPRFVMEWGPSCLQSFFEGLMLGDGSPAIFCEDGTATCSARFHTSSAGLADDVQEIACRLGLATSLSRIERRSGYNDSPMFAVWIQRAKMAAIQKLLIEQRQYSGMIYCVSVPNSTLIVRRGGRPMVCGNCLWLARSPAAGRPLYVYRELYAAGLRDEQQAALIRARSRDERIVRCVGDPSMFNSRTEQQKPSIAAVYQAHGVPLVPGVNARIAGWQTVRRALAHDPENGILPRLRVLAGRAPNLVRTLPAMVHDPLDAEDLADQIKSKKTDDHAADCLRYGLVAETMPLPQGLSQRDFAVEEG